MNQVNGWLKGIDTDSSYLKISNLHYLSLRGGNMITIGGGSSGAIETERGNERLFYFPKVPAIFRIRLDDTKNQSGHLNFSFGPTVVSIALEDISLNEELYTQITQDPFIAGRIASGNIRVDYSTDFNNISVWVYEELEDIYLTGEATVNINKTDEISDPIIMGAGIYDKDIILITTSNENYEESNGQIWRISIRENRVVTKDGLLDPGDPLDPNEHLVYSEKLNLVKEAYITKVVSNIETDKIGRIYFNDRRNPIRAFNLLADFPMNTPLSYLSGNEDVYFPEIRIIDVIDGGSIPSGAVVQYFFRFRGGDSGNQSTISPGSGLVLTTEKGSKSVEANGNYQGTELHDKGKSIRLRIEGLDTTYESIEIIYGVYNVYGVQELFVIDEVGVPPSGILEYIHTGIDGLNQKAPSLPPAEINVRVGTITKANDIAVKDGRLIAFGPEMIRADIDFDTRVYRFNNQQKALLKDNNLGDIILDATEQIDWDAVPKEHDAINPYNKEGEWTEWYNQKQYKYQSDGHTLGGEGKNISFKFTTLKLIAEEDFGKERVKPPYIYSGRFPEQTYIDFGGGRKHEVSKEFRDFRSPIINSFAKGYARGEVYRIFFNAYDKLGNPMYASWVADIRMPEEWDFAYYIMDNPESPSDFFNGQYTPKFIVGQMVDNKVFVYSLGMEFEVRNLDKLEDVISGYSFSMVNRSTEDKTKLGHGILSPTYLQSQPGSTNNTVHIEHPFYVSKFYGLTYLHNNTLANYADWAYWAHNIMSFRSLDDNKYGDFTFGEGDYIRQNAFYVCTEDPLVDPENITYYGYTNKAATYSGSYWPIQTIPLLDSIWRDASDVIKLQDLNTLEGAPNYSGSDNVYILASDYNLFNEMKIPTGTTIVLMDMPLPETIQGLFYHTRSRVLLGPIDKKMDYRTFSMAGEMVTDNNWYNVHGVMTASYKRNLHRQYGGDTYVDRQNNISYPVTPIIPKGETNVKVFSGDVCVSYFPFWTMAQKIHGDWEPGTLVNAYFRNSNYVVHAITESELNPYYASGDMWLLDEVTPQQYYQQDTGDYKNRFPMQYTDKYMAYPDVYKQKNTAKVHSAKPKFSNDVNMYPAGITVSNKKVNGDKVDSWLNFPVNQLKEVENTLGKIVYGDTFKGKLIFIQEKGIGVQAINEKAIQFNDDTGTKIVLGEGELLGDHGYISESTGTIHHSSVIKTERGIYFYDAFSNRIKKLDVEGLKPISDMMGIYSHLKENINLDLIRANDDPLGGKGVSTGINRMTERIFFTFLGETNTTISIYEAAEMVEGFPHTYPRIYVNTLDNPITPHPINPGRIYMENVGRYNNYYGTVKEMSLKFVIHSEHDMITVLTNLLWKSECYNEGGLDLFDKTITRIRIYNNHQDTGYRTDIKRVLRNWAHKVGMNSLSVKKIDRMRNEWHIVEMIFDNRENLRLILHDVISTLNLSHSGITPY